MSLKRGVWVDHHRMIIDMNDSKLTTLDQIQAFLAGTSEVAFAAREGHATRYGFIREVLWRFGYARLGRAHRGLILRYLARATGYSRQQLTRLVGQFVERGQIAPRYRAPRTVFTRRYTQADVLLLAEVDTLHSTLSGPATRVLLERALRVYADARFERLAGISVAHLYNLRKQAAYQKTRRY